MRKKNGEIFISYKPSEMSIEFLIKEISKYNIKIKDISVKDTSLEDLFKKLLSRLLYFPSY